MLLGNWKQNWSELHSRLQLTLRVIYIHIVLFFLFVNIGAVTNLLVIPKLESSKVDRKNLALEIPTLEKMSRPFNETQTVLQPSVLAACCIVCLQAVQTQALLCTKFQYIFYLPSGFVLLVAMHNHGPMSNHIFQVTI